MPKHLITTSAPVDHQRALRSMAAWWNGDRLGLDLAMRETMADPRPEATAALIFALLAQFAQVIDWSDDPERLVALFGEKVAALEAEAG